MLNQGVRWAILSLLTPIDFMQDLCFPVQNALRNHINMDSDRSIVTPSLTFPIADRQNLYLNTAMSVFVALYHSTERATYHRYTFRVVHEVERLVLAVDEGTVFLNAIPGCVKVTATGDLFLRYR